MRRLLPAASFLLISPYACSAAPACRNKSVFFRAIIVKMDLPKDVTASRLWERLQNREDYVHALGEIRKVALLLGDEVRRTIPEYTDHSVKHMDALWRVTD